MLARLRRILDGVIQSILTYPAAWFTAALMLLQAWFMRGMPAVFLLTLLPAALLVYLLAWGCVRFFQKRFSKSASRAPELLVALCMLVLLFVGIKPDAWWMATVLFAALLWTAFFQNSAPFWTALAGVLTAFLFFSAHAFIVIESRLIAHLLKPAHQAAGYEVRASESELRIFLGATERLRVRIPKEMHSVNDRSTPFAAIAAISGSQGPLVVFFEPAGRIEQAATEMLAQLKFEGSITDYRPPLVDKLDIPGYQLRGLVYEFRTSAGADMQLAVYCSQSFDTGIAVIERRVPGLPHEPLAEESLSGISPGTQRGSSQCDL